MHRHEITDEQWERLKGLLPGRRGGHGGVARDNRMFMNAVWYVAKTGIPWRDLPERFGKWDTVYHRYNEWCKKKVWQRILEVVQDPDLERLMLDSTIVRAHQHAVGMNGGQDNQALGRSRGGFSTKIHLSVKGLGNPVTICLSPGQDADITHAEQLLGDYEVEEVIADKGYDSNALVETIEARGAEAIIPPRSNRKSPRDYDEHIYKERNLVERCVSQLKQCRRVATRYEKTARNFLGMILFAAITIWLKYLPRLRILGYFNQHGLTFNIKHWSTSMQGFRTRDLIIALFVSSTILSSPATSFAQTLDDFYSVVTKYSVSSPAGGPGKNPNSAVFVFLRASKKLCWIAGGKVVFVEIQPTVETNDTKQGGPTPVGEYLIGKRFIHENHKIDWYKLYPRIEDNSGYYGYTVKTKTGRFAMGLHPGSVSLGCVTVKSSGTPYDNAEAWKSVRSKLDTSTLKYKNDDFTGLLYVEDK